MAAPASLVAAFSAAAVAAAPAPVGDLRAATDAILAAVSAARRIPARTPYEPRLVSRAELRAEQQAAVASSLGGPEEAARARLWARMGLLPAGTDLVALAAASLAAAPTAFYDPVRRRLAVPSWLPLDDQRLALAHELAHLLADQRFGARQLMGIGVDGRHNLEGDVERARAALVEGDATLAALEATDPRGTQTDAFSLRALGARLRDAPAPASSPAWLRAIATFAHGDGLLFVAHVRARAPWSAVDALWAAPPASTEQVLHPERYDARDAPVPVAAVPVSSFPGFRAASTDVLGELGARVWLERAAPSVLAGRAAAGWGGDRATLFEPDGAPDAGVASSPFVVWRTVWDDAAEAEDFARAAAPVLSGLAGVAASSDDPHRVVARGAAGVYALAWRGAAVTLVFGAPEAALAALDELGAPPRGELPPKTRRAPKAAGATPSRP